MPRKSRQTQPKILADTDVPDAPPSEQVAANGGSEPSDVHWLTNGVETAADDSPPSPPSGHAARLIQQLRDHKAVRLPNPMPRDQAYFADGYAISLHKPVGQGDYEIRFGDGSSADKPHNDQIIPTLKAAIAEFNKQYALDERHHKPTFNDGAWHIRKCRDRNTVRVMQDRFVDDIFAAVVEMECEKRGPLAGYTKASEKQK